MVQLINGDCLEEMKKLPENSVDAIVTDPPYELGFMGKKWDNTGIANNKEMWAEALRVLKPGGYVLSFSGTRTYHRQAVAIEDAGFEIRDMIEWCYGSGFPKSRNIGLDVDKRNGVTKNRGKAFVVAGQSGQRDKDTGGDLVPGSNKMGTYVAQNEWSGWGTALKPAHEPICMARKPLSEKTVALNVLKWGTGGINIDESRVRTEDNLAGGSGRIGGFAGKTEGGVLSNYRVEGNNLGRFPANLIHDNSEEVRECFPNESERFFKSIIYQVKASKSERNKGCDGLLQKQKVFNGQNEKCSKNIKDVEKRFTTQPSSNNHPTVKPVALMEYLINMVSKEGATILDPFMGSGSTGVACKNRNFIGIEMEKDYIEIAKARINN